MPAGGSAPSDMAEVLGEAVWIAEISVALGWLVATRVGAASGVAHRGRDRLAALSRACGKPPDCRKHRAPLGAAVTVRARRADARVHGSADVSARDRGGGKCARPTCSEGLNVS